MDVDLDEANMTFITSICHTHIIDEIDTSDFITEQSHKMASTHLNTTTDEDDY